MKFFAHLTVLLFAVAAAHADLVIVENVVSPNINGDVVIKVKADRARIDMDNARLGKTTFLKDLKANETTMLMHATRHLLKISAAQLKTQIEAKQKDAGLDSSKAVPKATGEKEKVGDWDCEIYTMEMGAGKSAKLWLAKDFPNYNAIKEQIAKMQDASLSDAGFDPKNFKLNGVVTKLEIDISTGKMTRTLISVKEEAVPDSEFEVPADYKPVSARAPAPAAR
jgi:hypothetical protein